MNIGEQINNLRKQHGLSQDDFANLFNVSRQTISNWENGEEKQYADVVGGVTDRVVIGAEYGGNLF